MLIGAEEHAGRRVGLRRVPIRLRITLAFLLAMTLVLGATGLFLYVRFGAELNRAIDQGLRSRTQDVRALVAQTDNALRDSGALAPKRPTGFTQVLGAGGRTVDFTPQIGATPLLGGAELAQARRAPLFLGRARVTGVDGPARLLATPIAGQDGSSLVVVVGSSLAERDRSLAALGSLLLIGGPVALLLASLAGYLATGAALRAVEAMRRHAEQLSLTVPGSRLPVPDAEDELRRLGVTLNAMLARNEATFAREQAFVSDASHELRTPLAVLRAELELALRAPRSVRQLRAALLSAGEEADRLDRLAEDLLVTARSGQGQLSRARVVVADALTAVCERFNARGLDPERTVSVRAADPIELEADSARLERALSNLVENALRHGGGRVELHAERHGGEVELHVTDEGGGFPRGFVAHAFERFSRADAGRTGPGSGLGLAIVRSVARAHGGEAHAANRPGGGADVWITLPARRPRTPAHQAPAATRSSSISTS